MTNLILCLCLLFACLWIIKLQRQVSQLTKQQTDKKELLGFVNIYSQDGDLRISCMPKSSMKRALQLKPNTPKSDYVSTAALYVDSNDYKGLRLR